MMPVLYLVAIYIAYVLKIYAYSTRKEVAILLQVRAILGPNLYWP